MLIDGKFTVAIINSIGVRMDDVGLESIVYTAVPINENFTLYSCFSPGKKPERFLVDDISGVFGYCYSGDFLAAHADLNKRFGVTITVTADCFTNVNKITRITEGQYKLIKKVYSP